MSIFEYDKEEEEKKLRKAEYEAGVEAGREIGEREGRIAGEAEGKVSGRAQEIIETGHEFGLSEDDILTRLQKKLNISLQKAQEYLAMFGKKNV